MTLKNPILLKTLLKPDQIAGMHMMATLCNGCLFVVIMLFLGVVESIIYLLLSQAMILMMTRRDPYFAEVLFTKRFKLTPTKRLNSSKKGNFYVV